MATLTDDLAGAHGASADDGMSAAREGAIAALTVLIFFLPTAGQTSAAALLFLAAAGAHWRRRGKANASSALIAPALARPLFLGSSCLWIAALASAAVALAAGPFAVPIAAAVGPVTNLAAKQTLYGIALLFTWSTFARVGWSLERSSYLIATVSLLLLSYCLLQRYTGIDLVHGWGASLGQHRLGHEQTYRVSGWMGHTLSLAYSCMIFVPLSLTLSATARAPRARAAWGVTCLAAALILVGTAARWPIGVTVVISGMLFLSFQRRKWLWLVVTSALAAAFFAVERSLALRVLEINDISGTWFDKIPRLRFWTVHWQMFVDNPIAGVGIAARGDARTAYYDRLGFAGAPEKYSAHNIYLQTLADSGLIGMLGLAALWVGVWLIGRTIENRQTRWGFFAVFWSAALGGLCQNTWRDTEFIIAFWMAVAILATRNHGKDPARAILF